MTFICGKCRNGQHDKCPGHTWCDCQHKTIRRILIDQYLNPKVVW